jgi:hypothetical protein
MYERYKKIYIDYEYTKADQQEYLIGVMYYNSFKGKHSLKYMWFKNTPDFLKWLGSSKWDKIKVYAHYGFKADFKFICAHIKSYETGEGSKFISFKLNNKEIYLIDTTFLVPASLEDIGKQIGSFKDDKSVLYDTTDEIDYNSARFKQILEYNKQDCFILANIRKFFTSLNFLKNMKVKDTIASTSFHFLYDVKSIQRFSSPEISTAYRGGFCELFKLHGENLKCYDINSLYPFVMSEWIADPYKRPFKVEKRNTENAGIYYVNILSSFDRISFIPIKRNMRNLYIDPIGHSIWLSSAEVDYLDKNNIEYKITEGWETEKYYELKNIIYEMYKLRENPAYKYPIKLCMNSSYGKFGEKDHITNVIKVLDCAENLDYLAKMTKEFNDFKILGGVFYFFKNSNKTTPFRNLMVASNITGSGRIKLFDYFNKAGLDDIYYCDTDSLYTTKNLDDECSKQIGKVKLEYNIKEGVFFGRKAYILNVNDVFVEKFKGTSRKVKIAENFDIYEDIKSNFINMQELTINTEFKSLTTAFEYMKNRQHEKTLNKKLTFKPSNYRVFNSPYNSTLYNLNNMPKTPQEISIEKQMAREQKHKYTEIINNDYFDKYAYTTYDKSLLESVASLMKNYQYA